MPEDTQLSDSDGVFLVKIARMAVTEFLSNGKRMKLESEREKKFSFNVTIKLKFFIILHDTIRFCTSLHDLIRSCTILHDAILFCTILLCKFV